MQLIYSFFFFFTPHHLHPQEKLESWWSATLLPTSSAITDCFIDNLHLWRYKRFLESIQRLEEHKTLINAHKVSFLCCTSAWPGSPQSHGHIAARHLSRLTVTIKHCLRAKLLISSKNIIWWYINCRIIFPRALIFSRKVHNHIFFMEMKLRCGALKPLRGNLMSALQCVIYLKRKKLFWTRSVTKSQQLSFRCLIWLDGLWSDNICFENRKLRVEGWGDWDLS